MATEQQVQALVGKTIAAIDCDDWVLSHSTVDPYVKVTFTDGTVLLVEEGSQSGYLCVHVNP